jgi:hypothetical protein
LKITNQNYNIPRVIATEWQEVLSHGSTEPMLILGIDQATGLRDKYVLKPSGHPRIYPKAIAREFLGAWIAMELGLKVFEPTIIEVREEFVENMRGSRYYQRFVESIGINFGTKLVPGVIKVINGTDLSENQSLKAKDILSFDMFVSNADRRIDNSNLLIVDNDLVIFDHELAFSFIMLLFGRNPRPWEFQDAEMNLLHDHYLYSKLKGTVVEISQFVESFSLLNEEFWTTVNLLLPDQWITDEIESIKNYLVAIINNREIFAHELSTAILR